MTETIEQLKTKASALSSVDRADLAHFLLSSLESEEAGHEDEWKTEIARRIAEIRSGKAKGRPADEVLAELREQFP
jgi:putative addiction module component (TIGR02574 family)